METTALKTKWAIDPAHSEITFRVKHLMITNVKGAFRKFSAQVESNGNDFVGARISAGAGAASIDTNNVQRDEHLKGADFFDAKKHPELRFEGRAVKAESGDYRIEGDLSIRGISKPVKFDVEFGGIVKDPYGNDKAGFSFSGKINRKDWGLNWNSALETGGMMLSDEVKIEGEVQLIRQKK